MKGMSDVSDRGVWNRPVSRRGLLQGGAAATFLAGLAACDAGHRRQEDHPTQSAVSPGASTSTTGSVANVRVTHDGYREHVGPSVACNPRNPDQLFVACQASPVIPEIIATYLSTDGGATWNAGGTPPQPKSGPAGDDVSVAYDIHGRGYICATRSGGGSSRGPTNPDANRGVYVWTTDDGGRSYSTPSTASLVSAGPQIAANNTGMVLMACDHRPGSIRRHDRPGRCGLFQ
jgi:hypothetical protein